MDEDDPIVHIPQEDEDLNQYLRRYTSEQRQQIFDNERRCEVFCRIVLNTRWERRHRMRDLHYPDLVLRIVLDILKYFKNYNNRLHLVLLEAMEKCVSEINSISKWFSLGRILSFTIDNVGTISGLYLAESYPSYAKWAFRVAATFGVMGLVTTATERKFSRDAMNDLMETVVLMMPCRGNLMQELYQHKTVLERAMETILSFSVTNTKVQDMIMQQVKEQLPLDDPITLLAQLLKVRREDWTIREYIDYIDTIEIGVTEKLIQFVRFREAREIYLSFFLIHEHPRLLGIARNVVQLKYSSWPWSFYICRAALPGDPHGFWALVGFNFLTITDGIISLWRSKGSVERSQIRQLKSETESELNALDDRHLHQELRDNLRLLFGHNWEEGDFLAEYLQGFTDEEILHIFREEKLLISFCRILLESFREFENTEDGLERLWNIISRVNDVDHLLYCIRRLEPVRRELLELLRSKEEELKRISKLCTIGRLLGSSVDIAGTVGGLWLKDTNPGYALLAFRAATSFGLLGLASTASEIFILKDSLEELMTLIRRDQELIAPIQIWYHQTNELEEAMKEIFPFDISNQIVEDFADMGNAQLTPVTLLAALLRSIAEHDVGIVRDERLIRNLINFTLYLASRDWVERLMFRRHPVILDITRIALQLQYSPLRFALCQSIPAMAIGDQSIRSFPVWGRIGLNLVSIADAIDSLRRSDVSTAAIEIGHLRNHLRSELASLQRIVEFIQ